MAEVKKSKQIIKGHEARQAILAGLDGIVDPVASTLGSMGSNVSIELNWGAPLVVHDGVTVAKHIVLSDPFANQAAQLVIQAADKTNTEAGDGTTTCTILTGSIARQAIQAVENGTNSTFIRRGLDKGVAAVIERLKTIAQPVETLEQIEQVATISCANPTLGKLIAQTVEKAGGANAAISIQDGSGNSIEVEYKDGLEFASGLQSPYMMTNNEATEANLEAVKAGGEVVYPRIVIMNDRMGIGELQKIVDTIWGASPAKMQTPIVLIADEFEPDVIASIVVTKLKQGTKIIAVNSPDFGEHRVNQLGDIASATGATIISNDGRGIPPADFTVEHVGTAQQVIATRESTIVVGGLGEPAQLQERIAGIKEQMSKYKDTGLIDKAQLRLSRLEGGVAVISVGANSQSEQREIKERVIDAVNATKAAIQEGIVPGGGVALLQGTWALDNVEVDNNERIGLMILDRALQAPLHKLVQNAGGSIQPDYAVGYLRNAADEGLGYDAEADTFTNMLERGIIDPVKVTRCALQNAASVANVLMTTNHMIAYDRAEFSKDDEAGIAEWSNQ